MEKIQLLLASMVGFFQTRLDEMDAKRSELMAIIGASADFQPALDAWQKTVHDQAYDLGVQDTLAKIGMPAETKVFSLEEVNSMIAEAVEPKDRAIAEQATQIESLSARVSELESAPAPEAQDPQPLIAAAVAKREQEIAAEIRSTNVDDLELADRLDPKGTPAVPAEPEVTDVQA